MFTVGNGAKVWAWEPEILTRVMMSQENLPMLQNNARSISKNDVLELVRRMLGQ